MNLESQLTEEQRIARAEKQESLAREVAKRREHSTSERVTLPRDDGQFQIADVMGEQIEVMRRMRDKWAAFCEQMRPQFEALPEAKACKTHPSVMRPKLFEETCQRSRIEGEFRAVWAPCGECRDNEARARQRAFWGKRGVPARVMDSTLANFKADTEERVSALGKVTDWIRRGGIFLLLTGTTGTGKGHLASGCLKAQGNGLWITHADMLGDLRASYTLHTTQSLIAEWQEAEMFVLDEFGLSPGGKDEEPMLYQVLASRYENRRPTIITSNLPLEELRAAIGFRLLDRMQENCTTVVCKWASWRTAK